MRHATGFSSRFVIIVAIFVSALLTANLIAVKLISVGPWNLSAAIVVFPVSYIIGDVLTEVYGYRSARTVIWLGFACNLLMVGFIYLALTLPSASFWGGQDAFKETLGTTPRILLASFSGYLVGSFTNAFVLARMKVMTEGRWLWTRTIGSTIVGEGIDSLVFVSIAFWGGVPGGVLRELIVTQWLFKVAYETAATPLTYAVVGWLKRSEGVDTYDRGISFNPIPMKQQ